MFHVKEQEIKVLRLRIQLLDEENTLLKKDERYALSQLQPHHKPGDMLAWQYHGYRKITPVPPQINVVLSIMKVDFEEPPLSYPPSPFLPVTWDPPKPGQCGRAFFI